MKVQLIPIVTVNKNKPAAFSLYRLVVLTCVTSGINGPAAKRADGLCV